MMKTANRYSFATLVMLVMTFMVMGGASTASPQPEAAEHLSAVQEVPRTDLPATTPRVSKEPDVEPVLAPEVVPEEDPWAAFPNVCETFTAHQKVEKPNKKSGKKKPGVSYRRNRYKYTLSDQQRVKDVVELVAREMGVEEPKFFAALAEHESSWHPEAIHILNEDLTANHKSWDRHNYSAAREAALKAKLASTSARDPKYWKIRRVLSSLGTYKDNTFWQSKLAFDYVIPGRTLKDGTTTQSQTIKSTRSVWAFGYGLYGHNAVLYTKTWSKEAPPWILCSHQGIMATIIEVWVAREASRDCEFLSATKPDKFGREGGSYLGTLRRLATGKCSDRKLRAHWQGILARYADGSNPSARGGAIVWEAKANFGKKWPAETTDRNAILQHMLRRAEEEGLLRPAPLQRKTPAHEPNIVASR